MLPCGKTLVSPCKQWEKHWSTTGEPEVESTRARPLRAVPGTGHRSSLSSGTFHLCGLRWGSQFSPLLLWLFLDVRNLSPCFKMLSLRETEQNYLFGLEMTPSPTHPHCWAWYDWEVVKTLRGGSWDGLSGHGVMSMMGPSPFCLFSLKCQDFALLGDTDVLCYLP